MKCVCMLFSISHFSVPGRPALPPKPSVPPKPVFIKNLGLRLNIPENLRNNVSNCAAIGIHTHSDTEDIVEHGSKQLESIEVKERYIFYWLLLDIELIFVPQGQELRKAELVEAKM